MSFIIDFTITATVSLPFMKENVRWELEKIKFSKKKHGVFMIKTNSFSFDNFIVQIKSRVSNRLLALFW